MLENYPLPIISTKQLKGLYGYYPIYINFFELIINKKIK